MTKDSPSSSKQEKIHYEFGGPVGTFFTILSLPIVIYGLYFLCNDQVCLQNPFEFDFQKWSRDYLPTSINQLFSWEATTIYLGWFAFHVLLERILPGETVEGVVLPDKNRLKYTMSGHLQFWVCLMALLFGIPSIQGIMADGLNAVYQIRGFSSVPLDIVYDYYPQMISVSLVFTFLFSVYL